MQQRFDTRKYSISDLAEWHDRGELELQPKFQRRDIWHDKARSFLVDTILRGKPIPKLYMRQDTHPQTRRTAREIVDGQQRLRSVFSYLKDGFKLIRSHNEEHGGRRFSELDTETQRDFLRYEFVVDLLQDMADPDVYDVFARLNTYSLKLTNQELRHAKFFGDFRTTAYALANEYLTFWEQKGILSSKAILRMAEAELVSDLLVQMIEGISEKSKTALDSAYKRYDDQLPRQHTLCRQFRAVMDTMGDIFGDRLGGSSLSGTRLFVPLFAAIYHMKYELAGFRDKRVTISEKDYPKVAMALEKVEKIIADAESGPGVSGKDSQFYKAYTQHWVHKDNRRTLTAGICRLIRAALEE